MRGRGTEKRLPPSRVWVVVGVDSRRRIVLTAVDENTPVAVEELPGQAHEATQVEKMLGANQARLPQMQQAMAG